MVFAVPCMQGKRIQDVALRMHVALPAPRDRRGRPPVIPASVAGARVRAGAAAAPKPRTEKDIQAWGPNPPCWMRP